MNQATKELVDLITKPVQIVLVFFSVFRSFCIVQHDVIGQYFISTIFHYADALIGVPRSYFYDLFILWPVLGN